MDTLRTYFIRSTHQASVHCDFIRFKSFELHKIFWTDELSAVYDVSLQYIRAYSLSPLSILLASFQLTSAAPDNGEREER